MTFTLLNQLDDKNHHNKLMTLVREYNVRVGENRGFGQFISHSALGHNPIKNTQYMKDDTLYFRLSVQPAK